MVITLDKGWIADVSMDVYSVAADSSGNVNTKTCISQTRYARYLSIAADRLYKDELLDSSGNIKVGSEYLAALLVCDLIQSGPITDYGITSESYDSDYSYTKSALTAREVKSAFMCKYEDALASRNRGVQASAGVTREDFEIEFSKLSQGELPRVYDSSSDYPNL